MTRGVRWIPFIDAPTHSYIKNDGLVVMTERGNIIPARFKAERFLRDDGTPIEDVECFYNDTALRAITVLMLKDMTK